MIHQQCTGWRLNILVEKHNKVIHYEGKRKLAGILR